MKNIILIVSLFMLSSPTLLAMKRAHALDEEPSHKRAKITHTSELDDKQLTIACEDGEIPAIPYKVAALSPVIAMKVSELGGIEQIATHTKIPIDHRCEMVEIILSALTGLTKELALNPWLTEEQKKLILAELLLKDSRINADNYLFVSNNAFSLYRPICLAINYLLMNSSSKSYDYNVIFSCNRPEIQLAIPEVALEISPLENHQAATFSSDDDDRGDWLPQNILGAIPTISIDEEINSNHTTENRDHLQKVYKKRGDNKKKKKSPSKYRPFKCDHEQCGKEYGAKDQLSRHKIIHQPKQFSCDECAAEFHYKDDLNDHIDTVHKKKRRFACSVEGCPYSAYQRNDVAVHLDVEHFKCINGCNFTATKKVLLQHQKDEHKMDYRFACTHKGCPYRAKQRNNMLEHDKAPHISCPHDNCDFSSTKFLLDKHQKNAHQTDHKVTYKYKCSHEGCPYESNRKVPLDTHQGVKHIPCSYENCTFNSTKVLLDRHKKQEHR